MMGSLWHKIHPLPFHVGMETCPWHQGQWLPSRCEHGTIVSGTVKGPGQEAWFVRWYIHKAVALSAATRVMCPACLPQARSPPRLPDPSPVPPPSRPLPRHPRAPGRRLPPPRPPDQTVRHTPPGSVPGVLATRASATGARRPHHTPPGVGVLKGSVGDDVMEGHAFKLAMDGQRHTWDCLMPTQPCKVRPSGVAPAFPPTAAPTSMALSP